ncbi:MAG: VOC family protein [Aequorivita sp.]
MKIIELTLYSTQIDAQKKFYGEKLGLEIIHSNEKGVSIKIGKTILRFIQKSVSKPYHFAFNIPSNKVTESLKWLKERVEIQKDGDADIVDFPAWNAESIYFYDADKNILEFIARKNLDNDNYEPFTSDDLLEISEIGLATTEFQEKFDFLISAVGVTKFGGGREVFSALGSETGLFILIDINKKDWFPTNDEAFSAEFIAKIELDGKLKTVEFKNETLLIRDKT